MAERNASPCFFFCGSAGRGQVFVVGVVLPGRLEDDSAGDLDGVVGEPLVEPAQQRHVDGGRHTILSPAVHQDGEQMPVQIVHRVVFLADAGRLVRIPGQQNLLGACAQFDC